MSERFTVTYHVRCPADEIDARARAIAVEQSVEMPVDAIDDARVLADIVGQVTAIADRGDGSFRVDVALATETVGRDPGQFMNMVFGNTSWHETVTLVDVAVPDALREAFGGPNHGLRALRARVDADGRALTCSALKPQGSPVETLADLARRFADGGIDYIKDDHGLAEQDFSPFAERVAAIAEAIRGSAHPRCRYAPSLTGSLDAMRRQLAICADHGVTTAMAPPMILGMANFSLLVREHPDVAFLAHPTLAGTARIDPALIIGKLFRLFGADAVIFPNYGGRFGYTPETCRRLADAALGDFGALRPAVPVPAGGMTPERVPEMLEFYGPDTMLLIGGGLLAARERLTAETAAFVKAVKGFPYG